MAMLNNQRVWFSFFSLVDIYVDILLTYIVDLVIYTPEKLYPIVAPYISPLHHVLWNELHNSMLVKLVNQRLSFFASTTLNPMLCSFNFRYVRDLNPWWIVPENSML